MKVLIYGFRNMFVFTGRTTRKEYWIFRVWAFLIPLLINYFIPNVWLQNIWFAKIESFVIYWLFFIPCFSMAARRLHDINKSAKLAILFYASLGIYELWSAIYGKAEDPYWIQFSYQCLYFLMLFLLGVLLVISMLKKGDIKDNSYGPNPYQKRATKVENIAHQFTEKRCVEDKLEPIVRWIILLPAVLVVWKLSLYIMMVWNFIWEYFYHTGWLSVAFYLFLVSCVGVSFTADTARKIAPKYKKTILWLCVGAFSIVSYDMVHSLNDAFTFTTLASAIHYLAVTFGIGVSVSYFVENKE